MRSMPSAGEEGGGPAQEGRAGGGLLVGVDLAVGEAGVVVDGGVDVVEADAAAAVGAGGLRGRWTSPAAAVGDPAELLDVDVDQLAGPVAFVAADDLAGGPVQAGQAVQAVAGQDAVHGRGGQAQDRADPCRAELAALAQLGRPGLRSRPGCGAVSCAGGWSGRAGPPRPRTRQRRTHCGRWHGRCPSRRRRARRDGRSGHGRPAAACRERSAGHYGGTRRPPCGEDSTPPPHTEAFAMIKPRTRQQRSWSIHLVRQAEPPLRQRLGHGDDQRPGHHPQAHHVHRGRQVPEEGLREHLPRRGLGRRRTGRRHRDQHRSERPAEPDLRPPGHRHRPPLGQISARPSAPPRTAPSPRAAEPAHQPPHHDARGAGDHSHRRRGTPSQGRLGAFVDGNGDERCQRAQVRLEQPPLFCWTALAAASVMRPGAMASWRGKPRIRGVSSAGVHRGVKNTSRS